MFKIFAETHKIIARNIYDNIYENYDLKLDKKRNNLLKNLSFPRQENPNKFKDVVFHRLSFEEKKLVVSQFIDRIMVFDDEIEIVWKV